MDSLYITVFTPTYNRGDLLKRVYESLLEQTYTNFEWLIIDDGSTDDTAKIVAMFQNDNKITIHYHKKQNEGKHTTINLGLKYAKGALFAIVDSDDYLLENTLSYYVKTWAKIKEKTAIAGILGNSIYADSALIGTAFIKDNWEVSFTDVYFKYKIKGDKSVAFKTAILKQYPFPEPDNIKFIFEAVVWHEMAKVYKMYVINQPLQIKEYRQKGLSNSDYKNWYLEGLLFSYQTIIKNKTYPLLKYPKALANAHVGLTINALLLKKHSYLKGLSLLDNLLHLLLYPRAYYSYRNINKLQNDN